MRWDRRKNCSSPVDYGAIGEDRLGIWVTEHPDTILGEYPEIWDVITEWDLGIREVGRHEYETKSYLQIQAKLAMLGVANGIDHTA